MAQHVRDKVKSYTTGNSATQARKRYVEEQESNWQELAKLGIDVPTRYEGLPKTSVKYVHLWPSGSSPSNSCVIPEAAYRLG